MTEKFPQPVTRTAAKHAVYAPPPSPAAPHTSLLRRVANLRLVLWIRRHRPLLCVLAVQVVLTPRRIDSAFQDEAIYIFGGHREIALLLHGIPTYSDYASYFSGAPFLYPVLGAMLDQVGGLALARAFSLAFMLSTTVLLYLLTRSLFDSRAALLAAGVFAVSEPTLFIGHFATHDGPALFLLALATWLTVRCAHMNIVSVLAVGPVLTVAVATKYAALLYVPVVVVLSVLTALPHHRWSMAVLRGILLAAAYLGPTIGLLRVAPQLWVSIQSTTIARNSGTESSWTVLIACARYSGVVFVVAVIGTILYASTPHGDTKSRLTRLLLGITLTGAALLAPLEQVHIHTLTSLHKHVGFGLLFAAPMAGLALSRLLQTQNPRRLALVLAVCVWITWIGYTDSATRFRDWPDSGELVAALRTQVRPITGRYLVEEHEIPRYYLRDLTEPYQWTGTQDFTYTSQAGRSLSGAPAYQAAIADRYFDVIALRYGPTVDLDHQIDAQLRAQQGYELIDTIPITTSFGTGAWSIWRVNRPSAAPG